MSFRPWNALARHEDNGAAMEMIKEKNKLGHERHEDDNLEVETIEEKSKSGYEWELETIMSELGLTAEEKITAIPDPIYKRDNKQHDDMLPLFCSALALNELYMKKLGADKGIETIAKHEGNFERVAWDTDHYKMALRFYSHAYVPYLYDKRTFEITIGFIPRYFTIER